MERQVSDIIKDNVVFLRESLLEFKSTGTFFPTSKWAAEALAEPLKESNRKPLRVLELGPGTGSVTVQILKYMQPNDSLTLCEINPRFMKSLKDNLAKNEDFIRLKKQITFFLGAAQELPSDIKYDVIVCAIPFLNLDLHTVEEIFDKLRQISTGRTVMTYYEFIGIRSISKVVSPAERKERILQLDTFFKEVYARHHMKRERIWLNLFPINIYTLELAA